MLLALVLVGIITVLLCGLLFTLASLACPIFIGIVIAEAAHGAAQVLPARSYSGLPAARRPCSPVSSCLRPSARPFRAQE